MCSSTKPLIDLGVEAGHSPPHSVDVGPAIGHVFGKGAARIDALGFERARREHPEGRAAANVGDLEPDALFGSDCHSR